MFCGIDLFKPLEGDAFAAQLLMNQGAFGFNALRGRTADRTHQTSLKLVVVECLRRWPIKASGTRERRILGDRANADTDSPADLARRQSAPVVVPFRA